MGFMEFFRGGISAETPQLSRDPTDDSWFEPMRRRTAAGVNVTVERARQVPVVRDCLGTLSQPIGGLSFMVFEKTGDGSREKVAEHPILQLLSNPNPRTTSVEFFTSMVDDLAARGGFFAEIIWNFETGDPQEIWQLNFDCCKLELLKDRTRRLVINEPGRPRRVLLEEEFWYIPLPPLKDELNGRSPILDDGREAIGAAIALQNYSNSFFANDATPSWVFKHKSSFDSAESKRNFLSAWSKWVGGNNRHKPAVLEYDMDIETLGLTNEEAQFLETKKEVGLDLTRLWRVPPHKVGILDKATFSNIEHQSIEFVTDTLGPWLELIERSIGKWLIGDARFYFEFNVSSLLRGDIKSRYAAYAVGRQWGWLSVNEIRRLENLNGIGEAGERFIEPLNMHAVGSPADKSGKPNDKQQAIAFLRQSVANNGGRPNLKVIENAA